MLGENHVEKRVLDGMLGGVGRGQGHRDHEVRGGKPEQHQHQRFALPARQKVLEQGDRSLPGKAAPSHLCVDRQRAKQRDQHENDGRNRRHGARRQQGDARLVAERGKVVDASQPDDFPPGMGTSPGARVVVERFAARQPAPDRGAVLERWLGQLLAEGKTLRA